MSFNSTLETQPGAGVMGHLGGKDLWLADALFFYRMDKQQGPTT